MSINQSNIADFIRYLFKKRKGTEPPQQLLEGWAKLNNDEIATQLTGLFQSWGLSDEDKRMEINAFLKETLFAPKPVQTQSQPQPSKPVTVAVPPSNALPPRLSDAPIKKKSVLPKVIGLLAAVLILGFLCFKYIAYANTKFLYTITDNVSIRDDNNKVVARMDLFPAPGSTPSFQKLKALDDQIYYKSIDNSGQLFPFRKVLLKEGSFISYLFGQNKEVGYVNTNYVVDNVKEFDLYQTAFKEVKNNKAENEDLKAIYRKIIIGSLGMDSGTEQKFIALHTNSIPKSAVNATYGIIKQSIKNNVKYNIVAGLSDGFYYSFLGDIQSNEYTSPQKLMMIDANGETKPLAGAYRFINKDGRIALYDCMTNSVTNYLSQKDANGNISSFVYEAPEILNDSLQSGDVPAADTSAPYNPAPPNP